MARFPFVSMSTRNIKRSKLRSILLLAGVALTVSLQIGIAVSVDSLMDDFIQSNRNHNFTDLTVRGREPLTLNEINTELIPTIQTVGGLEGVSPIATVNLYNIFNDSNLLSNAVFYFCTPDHPDFLTFDMVSGKRSLEGNEVIVSETVSRLLNFKEVGDSFTMDAYPAEGFLGGTFEISAIMEDAYPFGNLIDFAFIVVNIDSIPTYFSDTSNFNNFVGMSVPNLLKLNDIAIKLSDLLPDHFVVREKNIDELKATGIETYQTAMTVLIIASYVIEFLFITNIFTFSMKERSREFGILRSVGSGKLQVMLLILTEAFLIGLIGSLIGIIGGIGFAAFLLYVFKYTLGFESLSALILEPATLYLSLITGVLVTLLSGLWPLWVALRLPIVQTIHSAQIYKKKRRKIITWKSSMIAGIMLIIAGFITITLVEEASFLGFELLSPQSLVIVFIFTGVIAVEGAIISFIPRIGVRMLMRSTLAPLLLATKDIERDMQKSMLTIFTAALSLSLILVISMVSSGLFDAVPGFYEESFGENLDLVIETWDHLEFPNNFSNQLTDEFQWINHVSYIQEQRASLQIGGNSYFFGVEPGSMNYFIDEFMELPTTTSPLTSLISNTTHDVVITDTLVERLGYRLNDIIYLEDGNNFTISGICHGNPFIRGGEYIFVHSTIFQEVWNKTTSKWFWGDHDESYPKPSVVAEIEEVFYDIKSVMTIFDYQTMIEYSLGVQGSFIQLIFVHSFILSGLTQFIAILISTMRMERDVAITRSVGMSKRRVFFVFLTEASVLGLTGVMIGIINSFVGAELLGWYIRQSIPTLNVAVNSLLDQFMFMMWTTLAILVTLGSTWIPARRASQTNIIAAISGRKELKTARSFFKPAEFDIDAVIDKMHATPEYVKEIEAMKDAKPEISDSEIQELIKEIEPLSEKLDLNVDENKKWFDLYQGQVTRYKEGKMEKQRFILSLKRYLEFLKKN